MDSNTFPSRDHDTLFDVGSLYAQLDRLEDKRNAKGKCYSKRTLTASCFKNDYVDWPGLANVFVWSNKLSSKQPVRFGMMFLTD